MSNVAPLSAGFGWGGKRNPAGPLGPSAGASDYGWGLSPWGTNALGWGDEVNCQAKTVPARITPSPRPRLLFTLARRGHYFTPRIVGRAPGQLDPPLPIKSQRNHRYGFLARRGQFNRLFPIVHARIPDKIDGRNARVFSLARRGNFTEFPLVGRAPGQLDTPPFIRQTRRPQLPSRGWKRWGPPIVGLAPGQIVVPDRITSQRDRTYTPRRGQFTEFPFGLVPGQFLIADRIDSQRPRLPARIWRGQLFDFPLEPWRSAPVFRDQILRRGFVARRGVFQARIDPTIVAPPGSQAKPPDRIVPAGRTRSFTLARRGQHAFFPLVGSGLGYQTAWIAPMRSRRAPALPTRRGDLWTPVAHQQQVKVPDGIISKPRVRALSVRRSSVFEPPIPQYGPPPARIIRSGGRPAVGTPRRGRHLVVPAAVVATGPPSRIASRRPRGAVLRRGRYLFFALGSFVGSPRNWVIVQAPLGVDLDPAALRLAISDVPFSLETVQDAVRLALGADALVIVLGDDSTASFLHEYGAKTIIVREL